MNATTRWHIEPMCLFDLEATGVDPHVDRIVSAAVIKAHGPQPTVPRGWLVNPGCPIPQGATDVHGITTARAHEDGMPAAQAVLQIATALLEETHAGTPIVGHSVSYDLTMLWAECFRYGHHQQAAELQAVTPVIDTFVLDKHADKYRKGSRRLIDVAAHYGVTLSEVDAHGAEADALAAGRVAWMLATRFPAILGKPARELHDLQAVWKREQAESFRDYLYRKGDDFSGVSLDWPVQPAPVGWVPDALPLGGAA